jgi:hypothetical protein
MWGKGVGERTWCIYCVRIKYCVNRKMRHVEAIPGMGEGRIKKNDGEVEFNYDIFGIL